MDALEALFEAANYINRADQDLEDASGALRELFDGAPEAIGWVREAARRGGFEFREGEGGTFTVLPPGAAEETVIKRMSRGVYVNPDRLYQAAWLLREAAKVGDRA